MEIITKKSLISFTPLIQSSSHNLIRIARTYTVEENVCYTAAGNYTGIVVNHLANEYQPLETFLSWSFTVWLSDGECQKQEIRSFKFCFYPEYSSSTIQSEVSQRFIKSLLVFFPKDYANFFELILRLMQNDFKELKIIDIDFKYVNEDEAIPRPNAKEYENDAEIENVTIGHVQDVLEHAFPNALSIELIAECSNDEVQIFLNELQKSGIAATIPNKNEWIRAENFLIPESNCQFQNKKHPTVAIITCLFVEKQSIDAIIENSSILHKYSKAGDSNVYIIGYIGEHYVVATKLAMIGNSREATTSAGSITTRLLGSFQHIDHVIIVGVGGGVPHFTDSAHHVRLGDVVVSHSATFDDLQESNRSGSSYVYAHNYIMNRKTEQVEGFATNDWRPKSNILADVVKNKDEAFMTEWHGTTNKLITQFNEVTKLNEFDFSRPSSEHDVLTVQIGLGNVVVFPHPNAERITPEVHVGPVGAMISLQKPVFFKPNNPTIKKNFSKLSGSHSESIEELTDNNGTKTSENTDSELAWLNTSARLRDKFIAENQLKAIDAGFDSVVAAITGSQIDSWILIRGIADYQQGSTRVGRMWQPYASVTAASLVKTILKRIPAS